jgi:hypothetical protein
VFEGDSVTCMHCCVRVSVLAAFCSSLKNVALRILSLARTRMLRSLQSTRRLLSTCLGMCFFFFSKFIVPSIICCFHVSSSSQSFVHEREDRVSFSRGQSGSLTLYLNISLSCFVFSYSFSCVLFLLVLLILGFFKNVFFRVFWGWFVLQILL